MASQSKSQSFFKHLTKRINLDHEFAVAFAVLAGLTALFFARFLFSGRFFLLRDVVFDFFPRHQFYKEHLLQGQLPLWNPFTGCGEPFLCNMESAVFYPFNLLMLLMPVPQAMTVSVSLHVLLAGFGMWLLCRVLLVSSRGALLAAVAFSFSTFTITRVEFYSYLCSFSWYPLLAALFAIWLHRPRLRLLLGIGLCLALQFLGGYPGAVYFTVITLGLQALIAGLYGKFQRGEKWQKTLFLPLASLAVAGCLALALCAVQIMPVLDVLPLSLRSLADAGTGMGSINPAMLVQSLLPFVYGAKGYSGAYWGQTTFEFWLGSFYVGILPMLICGTVLLKYALGERHRHNRPSRLPVMAWRVPFLAANLIFFLLYAMGDHTPFFSLVWNNLSLAQFFRWPAKAMMGVVFSLSCLAGLGLDWLGREHGQQSLTLARQRLAVWLPTALWVLLACFVLLCLAGKGRLGIWLLLKFFNLGSVPPQFADRIPWDLLGRDALKFVLITSASALLIHVFAMKTQLRLRLAWMMIGLLYVDLLVTSWPLLPSSDMAIMENRGPHIEEFERGLHRGRFYRVATQQYYYGEVGEDRLRLARDSMAAAWPMVDKTHAVKAMGDFKLINVVTLLDGFENKRLPLANAIFLLRLMNCSTQITPGLTTDYFKDEDFYLPKTYDIGKPVPRAYVVGNLRVHPNTEAVLHAVAMADFDPLQVAHAEAADIEGLESYATSGGVLHLINRLEDGQNRLDIELLSDKKGLLVISDTFYPGWTATVNGETVPIYKVNTAFRAVPVPTGKSIVEMVFSPPSLMPGLVISLTAFLLLIALFARGDDLLVHIKALNRSTRIRARSAKID